MDYRGLFGGSDSGKEWGLKNTAENATMEFEGDGATSKSNNKRGVTRDSNKKREKRGKKIGLTDWGPEDDNDNDDSE